MSDSSTPSPVPPDQGDGVQQGSNGFGQIELERQFADRFEEFCRQVHADPALSTTPSIVAVEYQRLFGSDRTWVLIPTGSSWSVQAVGGIPEFQRRASVVQKLQTLTALVVRSGESFHWAVGKPTTELSPRVRQALEEYLDETHVAELRMEALARTGQQTEADGPLSNVTIGAVVCEWFQPATNRVAERIWTTVRQQAAIALQNAGDWSRLPFSESLRRWQRGHVLRRLTGRVAISIALLAVLMLLSLIPVQFTIDAMGELQPVRRRHVFASSAGIVRSLAVNTGTEVAEGATLLELDSPELEMEIRRTEGELQTVEKKIAAIEASRLDFVSSSPETASQINMLAGELKEQRQRRDNLNRELELLSLRRKDLTVTSPIKGRVVTWDLERLLSRRPVSRGQKLMTVSDTEGPWELELRVNDEDTSDLYAAMKNNSNVPVEFVAVTMPERVYSTTLTSISDTLEIRSVGQPATLLCRADLPEALNASAVEGMSVRGRIQCGRRSVASVMFTKVWRVLRERILFPWGW